MVLTYSSDSWRKRNKGHLVGEAVRQVLELDRAPSESDWKLQAHMLRCHADGFDRAVLIGSQERASRCNHRAFSMISVRRSSLVEAR